MLRIHTDRCSGSRVHNLQRGTIRWQQLRSLSAHDNIGEMVKATVRIEERGQTTCNLAAAVDSSEESVVVVGIGI